jgi:hypothetical protein
MLRIEGLEAEVGWYRLQVPEVGPRRFLRLWGDYKKSFRSLPSSKSTRLAKRLGSVAYFVG